MPSNEGFDDELCTDDDHQTDNRGRNRKDKSYKIRFINSGAILRKCQMVIFIARLSHDADMARQSRMVFLSPQSSPHTKKEDAIM